MFDETGASKPGGQWLPLKFKADGFDSGEIHVWKILS